MVSSSLAIANTLFKRKYNEVMGNVISERKRKTSGQNRATPSNAVRKADNISAANGGGGGWIRPILQSNQGTVVKNKKKIRNHNDLTLGDPNADFEDYLINLTEMRPPLLD